METKIYYIKGSVENPEGVRQALLDVCPDAENIDRFRFDSEGRYYYIINGIIDYTDDDSLIDFLKRIYTELQPKNTRRVFVEKTMYSPITVNSENQYCVVPFLYPTLEEAIESSSSFVGVQERIVRIEE